MRTAARFRMSFGILAVTSALSLSCGNSQSPSQTSEVSFSRPVTITENFYNHLSFIDDFVPQSMPIPFVTPGKICTTSDPDFTELRYPEQIPYCRRRVSLADKKKVAAFYQISETEFSKYEFDHYIPLSAGGANDISNLWPQPRDAKNSENKDRLELNIYQAMKNGKMKQSEAIALITAWRPADLN